jgi:hypothetical protein
LAVMGALVAAIGRAKIDELLPHVPAATRAALASGLGGGGAPSHGESAQVVSAVREAFVSAVGTGLAIGAAICFAGAILAWRLVESKPGRAVGPTQVADEDTARELTVA